MEEILASISRIVTDDSAQRPATLKKNEVLELTESVGEDGRVRRLPPRQPDDEPPAVEPDRPALGATRDNEPRLDCGDERLVSTETAGAAAAALSRLAAMPRPPEGASAADAMAGARTLEQIVGEALRPLLQAWLDEHLPELVEKLVREEVARIVKDAGYG